MRRNTDGPTVVWAAEIPEEHLIHFEALFPIHGARTWAVNIGLSKFLDVIEGSAAIAAWARESIDRAQYAEPTPLGRKPINLRITRELYERFNTVLPMKGATTWFIRRLILNIIAECQRTHLNLEETIERSISLFLLDQPVETEQ